MDEIRERLYVKVCEDKIRSCNVCFDRTYSGNANGRMLGEQVDVLYEVKIGSMVMVMCKKCLEELRGQIGSVVQKEGET